MTKALKHHQTYATRCIARGGSIVFRDYRYALQDQDTRPATYEPVRRGYDEKGMLVYRYSH